MAVFFPFRKLYYSDNGKSIYKRFNRYFYKKTLLVLFGLLIILNIIEIIVHIVMYNNLKKPEQYDDDLRRASLLISFFNFFGTLALSSRTVFKFDVRTYIYY